MFLLVPAHPDSPGQRAVKQIICLDAVGWVSGRSCSLLKTVWWDAGMVVSVSRYRFAYGPGDATATHCLLLQ